jgi:hypothetical protein
MGEFEKFLSRRYLSEGGWMYFCRICGDYKPQTQFYKKKDTPFQIESRCKLHFQKAHKEDDTENTHLNLNPLSEKDFIETQKLLERLGYKFGPNQESVHIQFIKKYKIQKNG